jgi:hypothetical protein
MEKVNVRDKLGGFNDQWKPKIVGELNGQLVKLVKFQGPFVWHHHEREDVLLHQNRQTELRWFFGRMERTQRNVGRLK